jgi:dTMP kinase
LRVPGVDVLPARFVTLEGIDQSGKKTQTALLISHLKREGFRVSSLSFPIYSSPSGHQLQNYLRGRREYPPQAVHMLYSLNRWENEDTIIRKLETSDFLLANRYSASNFAYGLSHGLNLDWLRALDQGLPEPDVVIVLDAPIRSSFERKIQKRDVHENNRALLLRVRRNYLKLAKRFDWHVVEAVGPAIDVHARIWETLHGLSLVR